MPYPRIIALIDQRIDRLTEVRELLSSRIGAEWFLQKIAMMEAEVVRPAESTREEDAAPQASPIAAPQPLTPEVKKQRVPPVRRRMVRAPQRTARQQTANALSAATPTGPVFVPASRVLEMQTTRISKVADVSEDLSPEERAKRWLLGQ